MKCEEPWVLAVGKDTQAGGTREHSGGKQGAAWSVGGASHRVSRRGTEAAARETGLKDKVICRGPAPECGMGESWKEFS